MTKGIVTALILSLCFSAAGHAQKKMLAEEATASLNHFESFYFGNLIQELEADDFLDYHGGYMVVRSAERYAVISDYGHIIVPYGQYLFDFTEERKRRAEQVFHPFGLLARSLETGMYGILDPHTGREIVACEYNELTPFFYETEQAIGVKADLKSDKRVRYFVNMVGEEVLMDTGLEFSLSSPARFLRYSERREGNYRFYDSWEHREYLKTEHDARYHGGNRFIVRESFNRLNKFALMDHSGTIVAPFQLMDHIFRIEPFQPIYYSSPDKGMAVDYVSVLTGRDPSYFNYALMDSTGHIYNRLRTGGRWSSLRISDYSIRNGRILVWALESGKHEGKMYLWNVQEENLSISVEDLLLTNFLPVSDVIDGEPAFRIEGRDGNLVLFHSTINFIGPREIHDSYPTAVSKNFYGGVDTGQEIPVNGYKYSLYGYGLLNENTGDIEVEPIFELIKLPDPISGLAYAELRYKGELYRGFIETKGDLAGSFRFLLR